MKRERLNAVTPEIAAKICALFKEGVEAPDIAKRLRVARGNVCRVLVAAKLRAAGSRGRMDLTREEARRAPPSLLQNDKRGRKKPKGRALFAQPVKVYRERGLPVPVRVYAPGYAADYSNTWEGWG